MNASAQDTINRWIAGNPTGDGWTANDIAVLLAAATTDPRIDRAEVLDAAAAHDIATTDAPDDDIDDDCIACDGTGLGLYDGASCRTCGGGGRDFAGPYYDEPAALEDDALVAYLEAAYESAVA